MSNRSGGRSRLWLSLIAGVYAALALVAAFAPQWLNRHIGSAPATLGLLAACGYVVFVVVAMGIVSRPFSPDHEDGKP